MRDAFGILCAVALALLLARLLCGCTLMPPPIDPHPPEPEPVPTVDPVDVDDCDRAGARLEELQCYTDDGLPTWEGPGGTWADRCREEAKHGIDYHPECVAAIESCEARNAAAKGELCPAVGAP